LQLDLSGPKLRLALEALVSRSEEEGGVEAYVEALKVKAAMFADAAGALDLKKFRTLCAHMSTVRRRVGQYAQPHWFGEMRKRIDALFEREVPVDGRIRRFCASFPDDREHRWVRDLAAEMLHYADPERYPLMTRWVWDARTNTGVLREIWHGDEVDSISLEVPDGYDTFVQLRQELSEYLSANGVFRDVLFYVDVLMAQVYAGYIGERGGTYLRADFATPEDPMLHVRRLLGLDGLERMKAFA
jgi:hypothetical protein